MIWNVCWKVAETVRPMHTSMNAPSKSTSRSGRTCPMKEGHCGWEGSTGCIATDHDHHHHG